MLHPHGEEPRKARRLEPSFETMLSASSDEGAARKSASKSGIVWASARRKEGKDHANGRRVLANRARERPEF